jgi:hypothetical protein
MSSSATHSVMFSETNTPSPSYAVTLSGSNSSLGDAPVGEMRGASANTPSPGEVAAVALGVAACVGILSLLVAFFGRMARRRRRHAPFKTSGVLVAHWPDRERFSLRT